ncbi:hypothetical protein [Microbacterium sp. JZ31]|uniref:hypothetical protein n=1 Tax=Microbacterium sp. JZ31 TaxID=1906274 RepID=UPI0019343F85|nr:hypothetical protein [Microbacterium sp. JZ31]
MSAMSWLHVRPRTLAGAAIVTAAAIGITTMAFAYEGNPTTELELHDGSVWITKAEASLVGHFNAESRVLDGQLGSPSADYDVLQDGGTVLVHQTSAATVGLVDTAAVTLGDGVQLPGDAELDYSARTVAVLDPKKGAVYVVPVGGLSSFSSAEAKPVLEKLGDGAHVTVGRDGTVHVASAAKATVYTVPVTPEGAFDEDAGIAEQKLEGVDEKSALSVSSVGERPVVLDATTGAVHIPGRSRSRWRSPRTPRSRSTRPTAKPCSSRRAPSC